MINLKAKEEGMMAARNGRLVYTVEEARALLRIGRGAIYEAIRRGEIPAIRIGRRILVPCAALERLLGEANNDFPRLRQS